MQEAISRGWIRDGDLPRASIPAPPTEKKKRRNDIEGDSQTALIGMVRIEFPKESEYLIHIPNGGSRANKFEGWRLKMMGTRKGVSDLFLALPRSGFHGLWIEYKAEPPNSAPVTDEQKQWIEMMLEEGYAAHVCKGCDDAMSVLRRYLGKPGRQDGAPILLNRL